MIPGSLSKLKEEVVASATVIVVKADFVRISGATQIETIQTPLQGSPNIIFLTPTAGAVTLGVAGNILVGQVMAQNRVYMLIWSRTAQKWYIHAVA
jgi:hypothetical protein